MDYRIFPVEFYSILNQLQKDKTFKKPINKKDKSHCIFLRDHSCSIYENRPVICRTHGLPLLYVNEDNEWELSNCELNFKEYNFNDFNTGNTFTMDKYNSKIFVLNMKFIHSFTERTFKETDLIPLRKLAEHLE